MKFEAAAPCWSCYTAGGKNLGPKPPERSRREEVSHSHPSSPIIVAGASAPAVGRYSWSTRRPSCRRWSSASGLKVLEAMLEEDRVAVCGPRYAHQPERRASRAGHAPSEVVLGGRKVALRRPRVRHDGQEVALPTFRAFAGDDPLNRRVVEQMLVGRGDAPVWPKPGAAGPGRSHPGHEQECGESAVRGPRRRHNSTPGGPPRSPSSTSPCCCSTACTWGPTASSSRWASMSPVKNTPWACGKAPPRTRPCVRGC